eukprot:4466008-Ditylum_brightwellii.AAC.1
MNPVLDSTNEGSTLQACCQSPANDASTNTSKPLLISGLMFSPYICCSLPALGLVVNKYLTICFTALLLIALGSAQNLVHWCTACASS